MQTTLRNTILALVPAMLLLACGGEERPVGERGTYARGEETCSGNNDCAEGEFCKYQDGACISNTLLPLEGKCEERPMGCYELYAPVCGCDGQTYENDCFAASAGTSIASLGNCESTLPPVKSCSGNNECAEGEFCKYQDGACISNTLLPLEGKCEERPMGCYEIYAPVCGCDGQTYENDCLAASAGTSIASLGNCESTLPPVKSCSDNRDCTRNEFCKHEEGACLSPMLLPLEGICEQRPAACFFEIAPVCGCDGQTYDNDCFAASAGTSVATLGECN